MPVILRLQALVWMVLAVIVFAAPASAACTVGSGAATFEPGSSYAVRGGTVPAVSASAGLVCNGPIISLVSTNRARARVTSANGFRLLRNEDSIAYTASADPNGTLVFSQGGTIDYFDPSVLSVLGIMNGEDFRPQIYARIVGGANVAAGTYTDTLTVQWDWNVCRGVGLGGACILSDSGSGVAVITVTIEVSRNCRIDAPPLSFGAASLASQFAEVTQTILADCTKGTSFAVSLTSGSNNSARPWRAMKNAQGQILRYNLYRSDGSTIWDETNPLAAAIPGSGSLSPALPFVYRARIDPDQPTPPAGSYSDIVSVLINF